MSMPLARPLRRMAELPAVRHLEVVATRAQRRARPRLVYAIAVIGGIGAVLLAQLMMSIVVADGAYRIASLEQEQVGLGREERALAERIEVLGSTQNLTANAEALGMVASGDPVFLDLATGAVTGTATAAGGSLVGSQGNLVDNSLLTGTTPVDAAAVAAAQEQADAAAQAGGPGTEDPQAGFTDAAAGGAGATGSPTPESSPEPAPAPAPPAPALPPGVLPSPTTR